jgi:hypothetical protein
MRHHLGSASEFRFALARAIVVAALLLAAAVSTVRSAHSTAHPLPVAPIVRH